MFRFIDTMLKQNYDILDSEGNFMNSEKDGLVQAFQDAVLVNVQNVREWYLASHEEGENVSFHKIAPLAKMPFPIMWCEWEQTLTVHNGTLHFGFLCLENPQNSREIELMLFESTTSYPKGICGVSVHALLFEDFSVDKLHVFKQKNQNYGSEEEFQEHMCSLALCPLAAFSFFNCSNVKVRYARPTKSEKRKERKTGVAHKPMGFIEIHKNMVRTRHEHEEGSGNTSIIPHVVRGHFKRFDADHKLFGTLTGMWFWEPHVRGGETAKARDYRVHGPSAKHAPDCIVQTEEGNDVPKHD